MRSRDACDERMLPAARKILPAARSPVLRMFVTMRQASLLRALSRAARQLSTSAPQHAQAAETKAFLEKFAERAPSTMAPPSFPSDYRASSEPPPEQETRSH